MAAVSNVMMAPPPTLRHRINTATANNNNKYPKPAPPTEYTAPANPRSSRSASTKERHSDLYRRVAAEYREAKSPGRLGTPRPKMTIAIPAPVRRGSPMASARSNKYTDPTATPSSPAGTAPNTARGVPSSRQVSPRSVRSSATVAKTKNGSTFEPMAHGPSRDLHLEKKPEYKEGTFYNGDSVQARVMRRGNGAPSMASRVPRFIQPKTTQGVAGEAPASASRVYGMSIDQVTKGNAGVALKMTTPRDIKLAPTPAYLEAQQEKTVHKPLSFHLVKRPAIWDLDLASAKREAAVRNLLKGLAKREVQRVLDEWYGDHNTTPVEDRLTGLGYTEPDAQRLASQLSRYSSNLLALATDDRKRIERFHAKMGDACLYRLAQLEPATLEQLLETHSYNEKERRRLTAAIQEQFAGTRVDEGGDGEANNTGGYEGYGVGNGVVSDGGEAQS